MEHIHIIQAQIAKGIQKKLADVFCAFVICHICQPAHVPNAPKQVTIYGQPCEVAHRLVVEVVCAYYFQLTGAKMVIPSLGRCF